MVVCIAMLPEGERLSGASLQDRKEELVLRMHTGRVAGIILEKSFNFPIPQVVYFRLR